MKDIVTPVPPEEVRQMIKKSLETAALVNYTRLSSEAKIEDDLRGEVLVPPAKKLEDLIHLAELCVDLLQQNEEHYAEVSAGILGEHIGSAKLGVGVLNSLQRGALQVLRNIVEYIYIDSYM